jgi:transcription factor 1
MASTLEQHRGCDILDINPGAGLWSQKLHEFLKPRSHVLLEPNPDLFQPFLDPLLNAPGSKYKLVTKDPLKFDTYKDIIDEGAFPQQTRLEPEDPKAQEFNKTLLVTGSLVWDPRLPGIAFDSMAKQLYHHFTSAAWSNDLFHAYGPVRTLLWVQSDEFNHMIAKTPIYMHRANRLLEMTQDLDLVVSSERDHRPVGKGAIGREPQYEIESTLRAIQSASKGGFDIPKHRRDVTHTYAKTVDEASGGTGITSAEHMQKLLYDQYYAGNSPTQFAGQVFIECLDMEKKLAEEYPDVRVSPVLPLQEKQKPYQWQKDHPAADLIHTYRRKRTQTIAMLKIKVKVEAVANIGEEMYQLEHKALKMKDGPKKEVILKKIEDLDKAWDQAISQMPTNYSYAPITEVDDRLNLRYPPHPRIQWDQRPFDPLMSREDETWPRNRVSLISATPVPRPVGDAPDWHEWVMDFVHGLYSDSAKSIPAALDTMQHGLSDIVKDCPSLTNPAKGGRLQLKHLRVRMLTMEMILELTKAYKDWPFKVPGSDRSLYFRHKGSKAGAGPHLGSVFV